MVNVRLVCVECGYWWSSVAIPQVTGKPREFRWLLNAEDRSCPKCNAEPVVQVSPRRRPLPHLLIPQAPGLGRRA